MESIREFALAAEQQRAVVLGRRAARPTAREWARHAGLFAVTWMTATFAGILLATENPLEPASAAPATWLDYALYPFVYYAQLTGVFVANALAHPPLLWEGMTFATALLSILAAHEFGHYLACRYYGVEATLPFFLPAPPFIFVGTFGAFIKMKSPIPSRRALFDIGLAGPLAGFVVIIPVAILAMLTAQPAAPFVPTEGGMAVIFNEPWLMQATGWAFGLNQFAHLDGNPFYFAAWIGLLVTSLNLMPVGQLDGGHASYSLFGARAHKAIGRAAFVIMLALALLGWHWHHAPGGFVYALLLLIMLRVRHPQAGDEIETLGRARLLIALLTLAVFALSFHPFPITVIW